MGSRTDLAQKVARLQHSVSLRCAIASFWVEILQRLPRKRRHELIQPLLSNSGKYEYAHGGGAGVDVYVIDTSVVSSRRYRSPSLMLTYLRS